MTQNPFELEGKTVLITGGAGNLGSAFARAMSRAGANVVLTSRTVSRLEEVSVAIAAETGRDVRYVSGDLTDRAAMTRLSDDVWNAFGRIDVVMNNAVPAGSQSALGDLLATPDDAWWRHFDPIVIGALTLAQHLVPRMAANGGGAFINLGSPTGVVPSPGMDAYGLAKGALLLLTKYMACEWGRWNIRANALVPGLIIDGEHVTEESIARLPGLSRLLERTSLGRPGQPDELVGAAVFLASDAARFISGIALEIDGGRF